jgi:two-component system, cell cycle response regulator
MRVLIADDDHICLRLTQAALVKAGHDVIVASDGEEAWQVLRKGGIDLAVLDWMMPGRDGLSLCRALRAESGTGHLYIILLTARGQHEDIVSGLDAGADDYLVKPFDADELRARLRAGMRIVTLERGLFDANLRLQTLASTDELTGLANRRAIVARLEEELSRAVRTGAHPSVVLLDVDHFKQVNDQYGHPAGDAVLRELSARLSGAVRDYDQVARMGGDEFLVVLAETGEETARKVAERLRQAITQTPFPVSEGEALPITSSLGLAAAGPGTRVEEILSLADQSLYVSKRGGGDRVSCASDLLCLVGARPGLAPAYW